MFKTKEELNYVRMAGKCVSYFARNLVDQLEIIVDQETNVSHQNFAEKIERKLEKENAKIKDHLGFNIDSLDFTYTPILQSGGVYDLRPQAESNQKNFKFDTIIWNLCMKYMNFNCIIARTVFINPSKVIYKIYDRK